jgi:hypothetical protein
MKLYDVRIWEDEQMKVIDIYLDTTMANCDTKDINRS